MKKRILIADDEAALLHTMAFTLKRKGYEVEIVKDGISAYKKIEESIRNNSDYDLIITDIQMPGLSGSELIVKIRKAGIHIPVLVITGFGSAKMREDLMNAGCNDYLDKPFTMNEFMEHIINLLSC